MASFPLGTSRKLLLLLFQLTVVIGAYQIALAIRFDGRIPAELIDQALQLVIPLLVIKLTVFWCFRLAGSWWRYVSLPDLLLLIKANLVASLALLAYMEFLHHPTGIPLTILLIDGLLCFLMLCGTRVCTRIWRESKAVYRKNGALPAQELLVIGAGAIGQAIVRDIHLSPNLNKKVVGFIDNDLQRQGLQFQGVPVLGTCDKLAEILRHNPIEQVVIAKPALCSKSLREIIDLCRQTGVQTRILPPMGEIISGAVAVEHIRDVQLEDLLGRRPVCLKTQRVSGYLTNRRVLITGAAGSIGSEICRQLTCFNPRAMILFDQAESPLFYIENELRERAPELQIHSCLCDMRHPEQVDRVLSRFRPDVIFHAAAYKHVPLAEKNPLDVLDNNVIGSRILLDAAVSHGVSNLVMISTDKAVNPTNLMGASKRAAELYAQNLSRTADTNITTVRFGNVLGSNGSVVPIFKEQIRKGGPVTVTHPEITRFFMTIAEAVQLVIEAGGMGRGGEIFLLDMGKPVKILHLAEELIRLSGMTPYEDIEITFTGLRPGEKLYEELLLAGEGVMPTGHEKICVAACEQHDLAELRRQMERLERQISDQRLEEALGTLQKIVPEYRGQILSQAAKQKGSVPLAAPEQKPALALVTSKP